MFVQLPQCLCIHLQRLTWSPEGAPIKQQEHVQFSEYLSMDRYKHISATQTLQVHSMAKTLTTEQPNSQTVANGVGERRKNCFSYTQQFSSGITVFIVKVCEFYFLSPVITLVFLFHWFFFLSDPEHHNNNNPLSNGSISSVFLRPASLNFAHDFR